MFDSNLTHTLSTTRLSHYLNLHELHILIKYGMVKKFSEGNIILEQGKVTEGLYIILEGSAHITAKILGEGRTKLASLGHGNLIGEVSIIDKNPSTITAIASSELCCLFISNQYLEMLAFLHPQTYYQLKKAIANEICEYLKSFHQNIIKMIQNTEMVTRPLFSAVIKSLHKPALLDINETETYAPELTDNEFLPILKSQEKTIFLKNCDLIKAPDECTLIQESNLDSNLYIILYGAVQSSIIHDNKVAKLSVLGPLELFSSMSIFDKNLPSIINYTTCERSILLKISQDNLVSLQTMHVNVWYKVFDLICQSFVKLMRSAEKLDIRLNSELYNR